MTTYYITADALCGEAYNNAINNVINTVNKMGLNWTYADNWYDAHKMADEMKIRFDINGNYAG